MILKHRAFRPALFVAVAAACVATGCNTPVDLTAVQKYAEATADAESSFSDIAADYKNSCLRRLDTTLLLPSNLAKRDLRHAQFDLAPGYQVATPMPGPAPSPPSVFLNDVKCADADAVSREWSHHNEIVLAYVHELGAIAAVDAVPTIAPAPLESPLVAANVMSPAQFDAFSQLATDISNMVIAGDQRAEIAKLTKSSNKPLHDAVDALKLVDAAYADQLRAEYGQTVGAYAVLIDQELQVRAKAGPADQFLLSAEISQQREIERQALKTVNDHRAATIDYASVLDGIVGTHQGLVDASNKGASLSDYVAIFRTSVVPLYADVQALKAVVK